jgi:hypothetical protein
MGSFEDWRARDQRWQEENHFLLTTVFQWFLTHEEWPDVAPLQHFLYQGGDRTTNVQAAANARPAIPGQFAPGILPSIWLGARHLLDFDAADTLLDLTVRAANAAVEVFLHASVPGEQASLPSAAVRVRPVIGQRNALRLVPKFVSTDHPTPFAGGSQGDGWVLGINGSLVMEFENVGNSEEYVARQLKIIKGWCDESDARQGTVKRGGPYRAFVVMPFRETWSETSRAFINRALDSLEEKVVAVRADEVDYPGRINDQIIDLLNGCDFVVADTTGDNANVGWELGFAYSLGKPCAIVRRNDYTESAPFDIYDHRRTDYSSDPTLAELDHLKRMIEAAIAQVRSAERVTGGESYDLFGS